MKETNVVCIAPADSAKLDLKDKSSQVRGNIIQLRYMDEEKYNESRKRALFNVSPTAQTSHLANQPSSLKDIQAIQVNDS